MVLIKKFLSFLILNSNSIIKTGILYGCGRNDRNQLSQKIEATFVGSPSLCSIEQKASSGLKQIDGGLNHTVLLCEDGTLFVCGDNTYGQLGFPLQAKNQKVFKKNEGFQGITQICCSKNQTLALSGSGNLYFCGIDGVTSKKFLFS